jgi:hypothetical protein
MGETACAVVSFVRTMSKQRKKPKRPRLLIRSFATIGRYRPYGVILHHRHVSVVQKDTRRHILACDFDSEIGNPIALKPSLNCNETATLNN